MWEDQRIVGRDRYRDLVSALRFVARQELLFGLHVHVGVDDPDKAIHVANGMRVHIPVLLGAVGQLAVLARRRVRASSPRACRSSAPSRASACRRAIATGRTSRAQIDFMVGSGVIEDYTYLWYDVRPHPKFGTVEMRMCDAQTRVEHTLALAALIQAMVKELCEHFDAGGAVRVPVADDRREQVAGRTPRPRRRARRPAVRRQGLGEGADAAAARPPARRTPQDLGSEPSSRGSTTCCDRGTGSRRQKLVYEANHDFARGHARIVAATRRGPRPSSARVPAPARRAARRAPAQYDHRAVPQAPDLFVVCKNCGSEVSGFVTECPYCGARLRKRAPKLEARRPLGRRRGRGAPARRACRGCIPARSPASAPIPRTGRSCRSRSRSPAPSARSRPAVSRSPTSPSFGPPDGEWWRVATAPFFAEDLWYAATCILAILLFGCCSSAATARSRRSLLFVARRLRRHRRRAAALETFPLAAGANGAALALTAAWAMRPAARPAPRARRRGRPDRGRRLRRRAAADAARRRGGEPHRGRRRPARRPRRRRAARPPRVSALARRAAPRVVSARERAHLHRRAGRRGRGAAERGRALRPRAGDRHARGTGPAADPRAALEEGGFFEGRTPPRASGSRRSRTPRSGSRRPRRSPPRRRASDADRRRRRPRARRRAAPRRRRPPNQEEQRMSAVSVRFLGHAAVALEHEGTTVLIDPFLTGNPKAAVERRRGRRRRDPADPRPRRPHRRHRRDRQAHRRDASPRSSSWPASSPATSTTATTSATRTSAAPSTSTGAGRAGFRPGTPRRRRRAPSTRPPGSSSRSATSGSTTSATRRCSATWRCPAARDRARPRARADRRPLHDGSLRRRRSPPS